MVKIVLYRDTGPLARYFFVCWCQRSWMVVKTVRGRRHEQVMMSQVN